MPQPRSELGQHLNRRGYIGGSDARTIMGTDEAALVQLWREKRGEAQPKDLSNVLMVQLALLPRISTDAGTNVTPAMPSRTCSGGYSTRSTNGWRPRWMAWSIPVGPCSRPDLCCLGHSRMKLPPRSTWLSCSTIGGRRAPGPRSSRSFTGGGKWVELTIHADRCTSTCCSPPRRSSGAA
jgi:hypothetical protein